MQTSILATGRRRVRGHAWPIVQTALAAVVAWYLARLLGVEHRPVFAPVAAVVSLGAAFGERRQRAVQLIGGVMLGIVLADLLVRLIGNGPPQIGVLVVLAMLAAVVLGGSEIVITEAAVSAILVGTLASTPTVRLADVLIGGGVALALHTLVFPPDPVAGVVRAAMAAFGELGVTLADAASALSEGDVRWAEAGARAAEAVEQYLSELRREVLLGSDTARWAPRRRPTRGELERYARTLGHIELAARSARLLTRNVSIYVRSGRPRQPELAEAVRELGRAASELPAQFGEPWRSGDILRSAMRAAEMATTAAARHPDLALNEIAGQLRSIAVDILRASEAGETDDSAMAAAPTEELLAEITA